MNVLGTNVLAIPGSLRAGSVHHALLEATRRLAAADVRVELYTRLGELPHFNPDVEDAGPPDVVRELRAQVGRADALLLSTPEYAHGLPGSFKNALDWLVGSAEFPGKPVGLVGVAGRAEHATLQLTEILATMSATVVRDAFVAVPVPSRSADAATIAGDAACAPLLRAALAALHHAAHERRA